MSTNPHYFIGVQIPLEIANEMSKWQEIVRPYVDYKIWTGQEDFHITIKFLGAVSSQLLEKVKIQCSTIKELNSEPIHVSRVHFFGKNDEPRVMYAEVLQNSLLTTLKNEVEERMNKIGFSKETRPYKPHITLAKKWNEGKLKLSINELNNLNGIRQLKFEIDEFHLYRVEPKQVPKYKIVESYKI